MTRVIDANFYTCPQQIVHFWCDQTQIFFKFLKACLVEPATFANISSKLSIIHYRFNKKSSKHFAIGDVYEI